MVERSGWKPQSGEKNVDAGSRGEAPGSRVAKAEAFDPVSIFSNEQTTLKEKELLKQTVTGFSTRLGLGLGGERGYLTSQPIDAEKAARDIKKLLTPGFTINTRPISQYSDAERKQYAEDLKLTREGQYERWRQGTANWLDASMKLRSTNKQVYARREKVLQTFGIHFADWTSLSSAERKQAYLDQVYAHHIRGNTDTDAIVQRLFTASANRQGDQITVVDLLENLNAVDAFLNSYGHKAKQAIRAAVILKGFQQAKSDEQTILLETIPAQINNLSDEQKEIIEQINRIAKTLFVVPGGPIPSQQQVLKEQQITAGGKVAEPRRQVPLPQGEVYRKPVIAAKEKKREPGAEVVPTTLRMTTEVYTQIRQTIGTKKAETGGILGGNRQTGQVTRYYFDEKPTDVGATLYTPNTQALNLIKKQWRSQGIDYLGSVHSHPPSFHQPSGGDGEYARRILDTLDMPYMLVHIVTTIADTGSFALYPFAAVREGDDVLFVQHDLMIEDESIQGKKK